MNVVPRSEAMNDPLDSGGFAPRQAHEQSPPQALACSPAVAVAAAVLGVAAVLIALRAGGLGSGVRIVAGAVAVALILAAPGFVVVKPNESRVLILFGRYVGTLTEARLWWVNPFTVFGRQGISLRVHNFQSERIKVDDRSRSLRLSCGA
jgi:hypothetical protein